MDNNTAREYKEFLDMLENGEYEAKDVYQEIMQKEKHALETINQIAEKRAKASRPSDLVSSMSLGDHYFRMIRCIHDIFTDCLVLTDPRELPWVFLEGDRKIYVGFVLVVLSLFLFFVTITV